MVSPFEHDSQMLGSAKLQTGGVGVTMPPDDEDDDPEGGYPVPGGTGTGVEGHEYASRHLEPSQA